MINAFIRSDTFENKGYWLRKHVAWFSHRYNAHYGIAQLSPQSPRYQVARDSLAELQRAASLGPTPRTPATQSRAQPKIIWMYWDAPLEAAPEVVRLSVSSWQALNPDYEVRLLSDDNIQQVLGFDFLAAFELSTVRLNPAIKADVLRLYLLSRYGGVWADSTTFCLTPLSQWLPVALGELGFFTFRQSKAPARPMEVWFIAAVQGREIVTHTLGLFLEHLFLPRRSAIFISNRAKNHAKLGVGRQHPELLYADFVRRAERFGFMPYFSFSYYLNDSLREYLTSADIERFMSLENRYVGNGEEFEAFQEALVSKQTYKRDYQQRPVFLKRKDYLLSLLADTKEADARVSVSSVSA